MSCLTHVDLWIEVHVPNRGKRFRQALPNRRRLSRMRLPLEVAVTCSAWEPALSS